MEAGGEAVESGAVEDELAESSLGEGVTEEEITVEGKANWEASTKSNKKNNLE